MRGNVLGEFVLSSLESTSSVLRLLLSLLEILSNTLL
jgi:hypothetical protein